MSRTNSGIKAVLTSDVHFNINTLPVASKALRSALMRANSLRVPLIIAGDLLDTKAIIRAECANELIAILAARKVDVVVLVGNHSKVNNKSNEHALNFLAPHVTLIADKITQYQDLWLIPYHDDPIGIKEALKTIPKNSTLIMHQGLLGANMGHYVTDSTSMPPDEFDGFRVISGHYHKAQTIKCGNTGLWSYIGSPYTITFTEANDGPKGIQILYSDGSLKQMPLNLRKHVIVECDHTEVFNKIANLGAQDLLWLKISGPALELDKLDKNAIGMAHLGHVNFKLDKIYNEIKKLDVKEFKKLNKSEMLDELIKNSGESALQQDYLKVLWREVLNEN